MIVEKIKKDIFDRSGKLNLQPFGNSGHSKHEFDYRVCKSSIKDLEEYYFVVSKIIRFRANSFENWGYEVYVYDKDGNYVKDPAIKEKCKNEFFQTLNDI
jgi:hypothetical protein